MQAFSIGLAVLFLLVSVIQYNKKCIYIVAVHSSKKGTNGHFCCEKISGLNSEKLCCFNCLHYFNFVLFCFFVLVKINLLSTISFTK